MTIPIFLVLIFIRYLQFITAEHSKKGITESLGRASCNTKEHTFILASPGCISEAVKVKVCEGSCLTKVHPIETDFEMSNCAQCLATQVVYKTFFLQCGGSRKEFKIKSFGKCNCVQRKCNLELIKKLEQMEMKGKQTVQGVTKAHEEQPCKSICRKCRTVTSKASSLSRIKNQIKELLLSCQFKNCKKLISKEDIGKIERIQKKKKRFCRVCKECKSKNNIKNG